MPPGTINTWNLLKKNFVQRFCPPSRMAKQLEDIHNFRQDGDETLYQACKKEQLLTLQMSYSRPQQKTNCQYLLQRNQHLHKANVGFSGADPWDDPHSSLKGSRRYVGPLSKVA